MIFSTPELAHRSFLQPPKQSEDGSEGELRAQK